MDLKAESIKVNSKAELTFHPLTKALYHSLSRAYLIGGQQEYIEKMLGYFRNLRTYTPNVGIVSVVRNSTEAYRIITGCFTPLFDFQTFDRKQCLMVRYSNLRTNDKKSYKLTPEEFDQAIIDLIYSDFISQLSILSLKKVGLLTESLKEISQNYPSEVWQDFDKNRTKAIATQVFIAELTALTEDTLRKHRG